MLKTFNKDSLIVAFIEHLTLLGVSRNTRKSYRSDLSLFKNWFTPRLKTQGVDIQSFSEGLPFFSAGLSSEFKDFLKKQNSSEKSVNRRLSTLRALSRFLIESQICDLDFMDGVSNIGSAVEDKLNTHPTLALFREHLETQNVSKNTVKNYLSDIKHFLNWLESNHGSLSTKH